MKTKEKKPLSEWMRWVSVRITNLRIEKGDKQETVARAIKCKRSTYSAHEEGRSEPPLSRLQRLCNYYHMTIDQFMEGAPKELC